MEKISDDTVLASVFAKKIKNVPFKNQNDNPQQSKVADQYPNKGLIVVGIIILCIWILYIWVYNSGICRIVMYSYLRLWWNYNSVYLNL